MPLKLYTHSFKVMGGPAELKIYFDNQAKNRAHIFALAEKEARRLEQKYSRYLEDSITTKINLSAGTPDGIIVDEETAGLLDYAQIAWEQSDGLFDITSGVLRKAWDFKSNKLPGTQYINKLLSHVGWQKLNWQNPVLFLPEKMEIDFGGVVKEYAADAIAALLKQQGIKHGLVELAGDISIVGPQPDNQPWKIGIRNPLKPTEAIATIDIVDGGIASSGNYERYMIINNKRYCHILNPKTGWPEQGISSVSVHTSTCLVAGTATTTALLLGAAQGREWLQASQFQHLLFEDSE